MGNYLELQLFAGTTVHQTQSGESSHTEGGSHSETRGWSNTDTYGHSQTVGHEEGGSHSESGGKTWASGKVEEQTQAQRDKYNTDYQQGQKAQDAYQRLQDTLDKKPQFQSQYENKLNELYDSIMNREKFSYDFNADSMYQMYKDKYTQSGKKAMEDAQAQNAILSGGYGSSYAQTAGQQTYQNYLQQLNDMLPTLRNQAYSEYQDEGNRMLQQYNLTSDAYNREYGQYRDSVSDWQSDRAFNQSNYQDERNFDYNQFANERNYWNQEYWNEKNAEQSTYNASDTNNWADSTSVTDSEQHSQTNYGETTDSSYWSDTSSNAWSNSISSTFSNAAGGNTTKKSGTITADDVKKMAGSGAVKGATTSVADLLGSNATRPSVDANANTGYNPSNFDWYSSIDAMKQASAMPAYDSPIYNMNNQDVQSIIQDFAYANGSREIEELKSDLKNRGMSTKDIEYIQRQAQNLLSNRLGWS